MAGATLLAVYQPWFGERDHINVGYDPGVLRQQIAKAREMNIGDFVVNWYGLRTQRKPKHRCFTAMVRDG